MRSIGGAPVPPFYAGQISLHAQAIRRAGGEVIPMHFGAPTAGPPPAALEAARRSLSEPDLGYYESPELKEALVRHYAQTYGVSIAAEQILLTGGASAALVAVFSTLFGVGERIAVARPGYPAYRNTLMALGRIAVEIDCGAAEAFELSPQLLADVREPLNGLLVASPANPTGATLSKTKMAALAEFCRDRGMWFISDEIYHGIVFERSAASALEVDADAVVIGSFSKLFRMPGWRLGWVIADADVIARIRTHLTNFFLTPPTIAQHAALGALQDLPELLRSVDVYRRNRDLLLAGLPRSGIGNLFKPAGAFYIYADVGHLTDDSLQFCHRLLDQTGVALASGIDFDPMHGNRTIRLSFAISSEATERALDLIHWHVSKL